MANFIPHNIRQVIDKAYGSKLTSEEYNNILNLLINQGDYNTDFLNTISNKNISGVYIGAEAPEDENTFVWIDTNGTINGDELIETINSSNNIIDMDNLPATVGVAATNSHTHSNKAVLDASTASFTTADETKLDGLVTNATHTGDVTGSEALTIGNNKVTNAKLAHVATASIKGRATVGTGNVEDLTPTQVRSLLNVANGATANAGTVTSILAGDGMTFNTIVGDGIVKMGTPSSITNTSQNAASAGTHSHYITGFALSTHNHDTLYQVKKSDIEFYCTPEEKTKLSNTAGVNTGDQDLSGLVPKTTTINGKSLSADVSLSYSDVGAEPLKGEDDNFVTDTEKANLHAPHSDDQDLSGLVPKTTTVNGKELSGNISLDYSDVGAEPAKGTDDNYVTDAEKSALHTHANKTALDAVSGTNTGDEDATSIKTKLGITTLSGSNTGDQDLSGLQSKSITDAGGYFGTDTVEGALAEVGIRGTVLSDVTVNANWKTGTWTADNTTDTLTCSVDHGFIVGNVVSFGAGTGALPGGISAEPEYYFVESVPTPTTVKIKLTRAGEAVDITSDGTTGWKIRNATVNYNASDVIPLNFSQYGEVDIYSFFDMPQRTVDGNSYLAIILAPSSTKLLLNDANVYGATEAAFLYSSVASKKYVRMTGKVNIKKIAPQLYAIQINISGLSSGNADLSSATAYTRVFNGRVTGGDITSLKIIEGYSSSVRNGSRFVIIRR